VKGGKVWNADFIVRQEGWNAAADGEEEINAVVVSYCHDI